MGRQEEGLWVFVRDGCAAVLGMLGSSEDPQDRVELTTKLIANGGAEQVFWTSALLLSSYIKATAVMEEPW